MKRGPKKEDVWRVPYAVKPERPRIQITPPATRNTLLLLNRQSVRRVDLRLLRQITRALLTEVSGGETHELGIHLVGAQEMALVNETFLQHSGSTDVITFDNSTLAAPEHPAPLSGELFICVDDAVKQAREFRTTWQAEIVRYVVHGVLHLRGYDDLTVLARRQMKREENRLVRVLAKKFPFLRLAKVCARV